MKEREALSAFLEFLYKGTFSVKKVTSGRVKRLGRKAKSLEPEGVREVSFFFLGGRVSETCDWDEVNEVARTFQQNMEASQSMCEGFHLWDKTEAEKGLWGTDGSSFDFFRQAVLPELLRLVHQWEAGVHFQRSDKLRKCMNMH